MAKRIVLDSFLRRQLEKEFGVSRQSVSKALNSRTRSPLADNIRKRALELGGGEVEYIKAVKHGGECDKQP